MHAGLVLSHNEYYELVKGLNNASGIYLAADWNAKPYRIRYHYLPSLDLFPHSHTSISVDCAMCMWTLWYVV